MFLQKKNQFITIPVITLTGSSTVEILENSIYIDAGATAEDETDGDITSSIITSNPINTSIIGSYTITYNVTDTTGKLAVEITRNVNVIAVPVEEIPLESTDTDITASTTPQE